MEYITDQNIPVTAYILCCECGTQIEPNPANMCVACLRTRVDITDGIPKTGTLHFCRNCERYLQPPNNWITAQLESRELLTVCLKKVKALSKEVRLVDAGFVWTEPHSKRIKVKLTVQKEVVQGAVLQQVFVVEFTVVNQMCDDCHRVEAKDYWKAVTQVRQKAGHRKTLFYLEQQIIKFKAHQNTTSIKPMHEGLDFYYAQKNDAKRLVDFLQTVVPCRYQTAQELISHDIRSNTYNYKFTYSVEIVPICKDNVVCLPRALAQQLGNLGQVCVVQRVTQTVHVIDPQTCQMAELSAPVYWRTPFRALASGKQLVRFTVMEVEDISPSERRHIAGSAAVSHKHTLADVYVVREAELGAQDAVQLHARSHLGGLLSPGDTVLGLDLSHANINDDNLDAMKTEFVPDVVLVKKYYDSQKRSRKRKWKLQHLEEGGAGKDTDSVNRDYQEFLEDLEEDPIYRERVNIYKDSSRLAVDTEDETDDEGAPRITLAEMMEDLSLQQADDATGEAGGDMID